MHFSEAARNMEQDKINNCASLIRVLEKKPHVPKWTETLALRCI
jgi:hypothetical protein